MTDTTTAPRQFTGWHMLVVMLSFFALIIGVNVYFAVVAMRSWTGLVVEDSYASGQDYNEKVQRTEAQLALGWTSTLTYAAGTFSFGLLDGKGAPLAASDVSAQITRPLGDRDVKLIALQSQPDGSFSAPIALGSGAWNVVVIAHTTPHGAYERRDQIIVP